MKKKSTALCAVSCNNYKGTCSDTTHQSRRFCTRVILKFCGYATANFGGPGVASSRTTLVWKSGAKFELDKYRNYLSGGQVLLASLVVYRGIMDDIKSDGIVSNYSKTKLDINDFRKIFDCLGSGILGIDQETSEYGMII